MNQRRNKRRLRAQLVFVYSLMALAVISIVAILLLIIQGYRYNRYDGKVEQGGLVQFDSRPSGADVTVDGINLANRTASKVTLTAGKHTVTMSRAGYSSWSREVTVKPGGVLWLNYTLLYPSKPAYSTAATLGVVSSALPSPDMKKMATVTGDSDALRLTTLDTDTPETTTVTLAETSYTAATEGEVKTFTLLSWDKDSHQLMMRYAHGSSNEYLSVNTRDGSVKNLTKQLGIDVAEAQYSLADSNVAYILTTGRELRRANLSDMTLSGPLVTNVSAINLTEKNNVDYATLPDAHGVRTVGYVSTGATKPKTLKQFTGLAADVPLRVISGTYYGEHYVVVAHGETIDIYKADIPGSDSGDAVSLSTPLDSMKLVGGAVYLGFTAESNRFIYAQRDATVATYDLELSRAATRNFAAPLTRSADWIDAYHVASSAGGNGEYSDFDGTNGVSFATNINDLPIALSSGNKYLYYFATTDGTTKLMRAKMTTN